MLVYIIGGGRTGSYLAQELAAEEGKQVVIVDKDRSVCEALAAKGFDAHRADACDPRQLEETGIRTASVAVVATGDDEDNLVICQLLREYFGVPRTIARVNHPANRWLYTREWGVDVAVSATHIIAEILKQEVGLGHLVTLLALKGGQVAIVELAVRESSPLVGRRVRDLDLPTGSLLVAVVRDGDVVIPQGDTELLAGDEILALTSTEREEELARALGS